MLNMLKARRKTKNGDIFQTDRYSFRYSPQLTDFMQVVNFYTPEKCLKTSWFLKILEGIKMENWRKMG